MTPEQRFAVLVGDRKPDECWPVEAHRGGGNRKYMTFLIDGKGVYLHRFSYGHFVGPIPEGMTIDHMCGVHACVNPRHLRAVPPAVNVRSHWQEQRSVCRNGLHEMTPENIKWGGRRQSREGRPSRMCLACFEANQSRLIEKRRQRTS